MARENRSVCGQLSDVSFRERDFPRHDEQRSSQGKLRSIFAADLVWIPFFETLLLERAKVFGGHPIEGLYALSRGAKRSAECQLAQNQDGHSKESERNGPSFLLFERAL